MSFSDLCSYFIAKDVPPDVEGEAATAGWLLAQKYLGGLLSQDNPSDTRNSIRNSFNNGEQIKDKRRGNIIITSPPAPFDQNNYQDTASGIAALICSDIQRAETSFRAALVEMLQNVVQHATVGTGWVAAVRTSYYASMVIMDKGCGFAKSFSRAFEQIDKKNFPSETWDDLALKWALLPEITSSTGQDASNAGMGLPRLLNAAAATCVISGKAGVFNCPNLNVLPTYYQSVIQERYNTQKLKQRQKYRWSLSQDRAHKGVVVGAFFNLQEVPNRIDANIVGNNTKALFDDFKSRYGPGCARAVFGRYAEQ